MGVQPVVPLIGLTGGMGAGKSTALAALQRLGAAVLSTDAVVHELYGSESVRAAVVERWGEQVAPGGVVDRDAIARHVFASEDERKWLEGVLWPLVGQRIADWVMLTRAQNPPPKAAIVEVPLLFEAGMDAAFEATLAIVASEPLRQERAAGRGHVLVDERATRQLPQAEKARRASFTVHNDGSEQELERELARVLDGLRG